MGLYVVDSALLISRIVLAKLDELLAHPRVLADGRFLDGGKEYVGGLLLDSVFIEYAEAVFATVFV